MGAVGPFWNPKNLQRQTPFHVEIRDLQCIVQPLQFRVEAGVLGLLPVGCGLVAEEDPAPKGSDLVYGAELVMLERTPPDRPAEGVIAELSDKCPHLHGRDEQVVPELIKTATASRSLANGLAKIDCITERAIDILDRFARI